jgi:hypothetical protein
MYILRLLYVIRCFRVMACLRFQLVDNCIKTKLFLSLVSFSRILFSGKVSSIVKLDF